MGVRRAVCICDRCQTCTSQRTTMTSMWRVRGNDGWLEHCSQVLCCTMGLIGPVFCGGVQWQLSISRCMIVVSFLVDGRILQVTAFTRRSEVVRNYCRCHYHQFSVSLSLSISLYFVLFMNFFCHVIMCPNLFHFHFLH